MASADQRERHGERMKRDGDVEHKCVCFIAAWCVDLSHTLEIDLMDVNKIKNPSTFLASEIYKWHALRKFWISAYS